MTRIFIVVLVSLAATGARADSGFVHYPELEPSDLPLCTGEPVTAICTDKETGTIVFPELPATRIVIDEHDWHLLTVSYGGAVRLLKGLTKQECEYSRARALGLPATSDEEKAKEDKERTAYERRKALMSKCPAVPPNEWPTCLPSLEIGHAPDPGDIKTAECFQ